jgi:hypothetical protein
MARHIGNGQACPFLLLFLLIVAVSLASETPNEEEKKENDILDPRSLSIVIVSPLPGEWIHMHAFKVVVEAWADVEKYASCLTQKPTRYPKNEIRCLFVHFAEAGLKDLS